MAAKLRPDSTFAQLEPEQLDAVNAALLGGASSYTDVSLMLREWGYKLSIQSVGEYYRRHLLPEKWRVNNKTAEVLDGIDRGNLDDATFTALKQATFDLATSPNGDHDTIIKMFSTVLKGQQFQLDRDKFDLLLRREAQAQDALTDTTLTAEEKERKMRAIFGMNQPS